MQERRRAREFVVQVSYAHEIQDGNLDQTFDLLAVNTELSDDLLKFARELLNGIMAHRKEFDELIASKSRNWDIARIALIDRLILRMALTEFFYFNDIPPKVSMSEAIEIAKVFSTDESSSFVNGILDAILNDALSAGKISMI
ncbi:MAG: transcription antitermination factor NusB [Candidatus Marinimicrobia bacterium]|nr:transcription antitermination factor NusB [Candidatus Neomarinimicrobiota bacterium]